VLKLIEQVKARRRHKMVWPVCVSVLLVLTFGSFMSASVEAQEKNKSVTSKAQYTAEGAKRCLYCHAGERMTLMSKTAHGNQENPNAPYAKHGCESCHGPGSLHVSRARGGRGFPALASFSQGNSVKQEAEICVSCHNKDMGKLKGMQWTGSVHATMGMSCVGCHKVHVLENPLQEHKNELEICKQCHGKQITNHRRFEKMSIDFNKLSCHDCHDVHQLIRKQ